MHVTNFIGCNNGHWKVEKISAVVGTSLTMVSHIQVVVDTSLVTPEDASWKLTGFIEAPKYVRIEEAEQLNAAQQNLGRPSATRAALIPIRKNEAWWRLTNEQQREIFEEQSHHIKIGLGYLPAIARQLYHCKHDFDFITWFEFAAADASAFEELVKILRQTEEWKYVAREVDIRLTKV